VPVNVLLDQKWASPQLQFNFLQHAINSYVSGEDKTFNFGKCAKKIGQQSDIPCENPALLDVWSSPEVLQILFQLAESTCYSKVRHFLDQPMQQCPQYLLLALA